MNAARKVFEFCSRPRKTFYAILFISFAVVFLGRCDSLKGVLRSMEGIFSPEETLIYELLLSLDQAHLFADWDPVGTNEQT